MTGTHSHADEPTVSTSRLPDPGEPIPAVAWPTVGVYLGALLLFDGSTGLALAGSIPYALAIPLNAFANYMFFTVLHDASHRSISQRDAVNSWFGLLSTPFVTPLASYSVFRFIHMQHHRFTNHDVSEDPDAYTTAGAAWSWPLRWATLDISYLFFYFPRLGSRPRKERIEYGVTDAYLAQDPPLRTFAGRDLDPEVYRRRRGLTG